jgi:hypothetical protein
MALSDYKPVRVNINKGQFDSLLAKYMHMAYLEIGKLVVNDARIFHNYRRRTGNLRDATRYRVDKVKQNLRIYISDKQAPYGKWIHDGHWSKGPDKFIDEAIINNEAIIEQVIEKYVAMAVKEFNNQNRL